MEKSIFTQEYRTLLQLLRETREAANVTQVEFARRLRKSQSFVSKAERGDVRLDLVQIRNMCRTLDVDFLAFVRDYEKRLGGVRD